MTALVRAPTIDRERLERTGQAPIQTAGWRALCGACGHLTRKPGSYDDARKAMREHRRVCPQAVRHAR